MAVLRFRRCGLAVSLSFLLAACSGNTDSQSSGLELSGSVGDGPAIGASLVVTDADGAVLEEHTSDDLAGYSLELPPDTMLPVRLSATGGTDLVTGRALDFTLLGAALAAGSSTVNVSPLTTLAVRAAECTAEGLTAESLEAAWQRVHAQLGMGLDAAQVPDPMSEPVNRDNVEAIVLANEALGEAVRRAERALSSAGSPAGGDEILTQVACDLMERPVDADTPVDARVVTAFKAAELTVRLETIAGRLEVDGSAATDRMNDAIRRVMPDFAAPAVQSVEITDAAREQTSALISVFLGLADDALLEIAATLDSDAGPALRSSVDAALSPSLEGDLHTLTTNVAFADTSVLTEVTTRRRQQPKASRPVVSLAADRDTVAAGERVKLSWASSNAERCVSSWAGEVASEGVAETSPLQATTSFRVSCAGLRGTAKDQVTVEVADSGSEPDPDPAPDPEPEPAPAPTLTFSASDTTVIAGASVTLNWGANDADTCVATGGWSGTRAVSGSESVGPLGATTTFGLTCSGDGGSTTRDVTVQVQAPVPDPDPEPEPDPEPDPEPEPEPAPAPMLTFTGSPAAIVSGESVRLTWSASNAASCEAGGSWSGSRSTSGSVSVAPTTSSHTYRLTCTGEGGSASRSVDIDVEPAPEPTVSLNGPSVVDSGSTATLTWSSTNATSCTASGGWSGSPPTSGSATVGPLTRRTSFTLTCSGSGGNALTTISVAVNGTVELEWQAPTENVDGTPLDDLASYRIYYGTSSRSYSGSLPVDASASSHTLELPSGEYYIAMTAIDTEGNESSYSNEVVRNVD